MFTTCDQQTITQEMTKKLGWGQLISKRTETCPRFIYQANNCFVNFSLA